MPQQKNFITLSRSALYELVWTRPVTELAKEFGISDVALTKRCRALKIPVPPRGHWAKVAAGQTPKRPRLLGFHDPRAKKQARGAAAQRERSHLPGGRPASPSLPSYASISAGEEPVISFAPAPEPKPAKPPLSNAEATLRARIDALDVAPVDTLLHAHPAVLRTAVRLKHLKSSDITWPRGTRSGPILTVNNVSDSQIDRALRVLDTALRACDAMNWRFEAPPPREPPTYRGRGTWGPTPAAPPVIGHLLVDGEPLQLRIDERRRQFDHVPTATEIADRKAGRHVWAPRFDFEPSGELRLHLFDADSSLARKTWKDTKSHPLETQASKILHGLLDRALELKRDREEQHLRDLARREHERLQALQRARRATNAKMIHELERQAGAWDRAQRLRRYLRAAKRVAGADGFLVKADERTVDFLAWAEQYVNQLDPLHPAPRDPDCAHERSFQYGADDRRATEEQLRLSGHAWESALKLLASSSTNDGAQDDD